MHRLQCHSWFGSVRGCRGGGGAPRAASGRIAEVTQGPFVRFECHYFALETVSNDIIIVLSCYGLTLGSADLSRAPTLKNPMKCISRNSLSLSEGVRYLLFCSRVGSHLCIAVLRPKFETEISIQDRHPASEFGFLYTKDSLPQLIHRTVLFIDLMKFYDKLLPPTIAKKKRESERKMPIRKRTAPIDMRMSRSRLSVGTDARDWLAAQRVNGSVPPPVPPVPSKIETGAPPPTEAKDTPPVPAPEKTEEPAEAENTPVSSVPAPEQPPVQEFVSPPPPAPEQPPIVEAAAPEVIPSDESARPSFKEPPPELDDLPPRPPAFKEPDLGDVSPPPPRPTFAEPIESKDEVDIKSPASATFVSPSDTPTSPASPAVRVRTPLSATSPSARKFASRSPSPPGSAAEDQPIGGAGSRVSLSRNTSAEAGRVRGPRGSRPPRTGGGGSVSNMVANLNRTSMVGNPPASPGARATSPPGSAKGRPASSLIEERRRSLNRMSGGAGAGGARTGSLSRRTMESDAEDNIVG